MIEVRSPIAIQPEPGTGYELCFWVLDAFSHATPFRGMLCEIARGIGLDPEHHLKLPPYVDGEDFIEGNLIFKGVDLVVYFEYTRSFFSVSSCNRGVLTDFLEGVSPLVRVSAQRP